MPPLGDSVRTVVAVVLVGLIAAGCALPVASPSLNRISPESIGSPTPTGAIQPAVTYNPQGLPTSIGG